MPTSNEPAPPVPRRAHPTQVRLAFGGDPDQPAAPAVLLARQDGVATLGILRDHVVRRFRVGEVARLAAVLARPDLCRLGGRPLVLVNPRYRVMAIAVGPPVPPDHVEINYGVSRLEDGAAVEMPGVDGQPSWHVFGVEEVA